MKKDEHRSALKAVYNELKAGFNFEPNLRDEEDKHICDLLRDQGLNAPFFACYLVDSFNLKSLKMLAQVKSKDFRKFLDELQVEKHKDALREVYKTVTGTKTVTVGDCVGQCFGCFGQ